MRIRKTTPQELLAEYNAEAGGQLFKPCKTKQHMEFFLKAVAVCPECDIKIDFVLGQEENLYHECNRGNTVTIAPTSLESFMTAKRKGVSK